MDDEERIHCPACGYNLRGLPDGSCPECGSGFERETLARMQRPTVSMGAIRFFALVWPVLFTALVMPMIAVASGLAGWLFSVLFNRELFALIVGLSVGVVLTCLVCLPVCKDLALQTARYRRLVQYEAEPVSNTRLFVLYYVFEVGAILGICAVLVLVFGVPW